MSDFNDNFVMAFKSNPEQNKNADSNFITNPLINSTTLSNNNLNSSTVTTVPTNASNTTIEVFDQKTDDKDFRIYKNVAEHIEIAYPYNWTKHEINDIPIVKFNSPPDGLNSDSIVSLGVYIDLQSTLDGNTNLSKLMDTGLFGDANYYQDFQLINSTTDFKLAGLPAYKFSFTYTNSESGKTELRHNIGTFKDRIHYFIIIKSPSEMYPRYDATINTMLMKFKIS